jgi:hypothetical protein
MSEQEMSGQQLEPHVRTAIDGFITAVSPYLVAYQKTTFSYLATIQGSSFNLRAGRLALAIVGAPRIGHFRSERVVAGTFLLDDVGVDLREFLYRAANGRIETPEVELSFPGVEGHRLASFTPIVQSGRQTNNRIAALTITGRPTHGLPLDPSFDWEVRAAITPYDGITDLVHEFNLAGVDVGNSTLIEALAFNVAVVDHTSTVNGTKAQLRILLAQRLPIEQAALGYRIYNQGAVSVRGRVSAADMTWTQRDGLKLGHVELDIPEGGAIHCVAVYAGVAQNHSWVADRDAVPNPRRAAIEAFDPGLTILQSFLSRTDGRQRDARDLEFATAWMLSMLGFNVAHLGGTSRTQDALDLIATAPNGHFLAVECTTGLLKAEYKLPLLIDRAEALREKLRRSGTPQLRVLPVIVSSKNRAELSADLEQAQKLGVLVISQENIQELLGRTFLVQDANRLYEEAEERLRTEAALVDAESTEGGASSKK